MPPRFIEEKFPPNQEISSLTGRRLEICRLIKTSPNGLAGVDIIKNNKTKIPSGTIYQTLRRLQEDGILEVVGVTRGQVGAPQPIYNFTKPFGEKVIEATEVFINSISNQHAHI